MKERSDYAKNVKALRLEKESLLMKTEAKQKYL
jgi:hypothetical protein